jgi:hypothetical protein
VGQRAAATEARLDLEVDLERSRHAGRRRARGSLEHAFGPDPRPDADGDPAGDRRRHELRGHRIEHEEGQADARLAQLDGLGQGRHRQPVDACRLERPGHRHRPVAVGVRLHDRLHAHGGSDGLPEHTQVAEDRIEIDLQPRGPREGGQAGA